MTVGMMVNKSPVTWEFHFINEAISYHDRGAGNVGKTSDFPVCQG